METGKLTLKIQTEIIAEYENYVVLAFYVDGKFSKVFTIDTDREEIME